MSWVVVGIVTVSCRKESRLVLGYALYTVITIVVTICIHCWKRVWLGFGPCRLPICMQTSYYYFFTDFTQSHELVH